MVISSAIIVMSRATPRNSSYCVQSVVVAGGGGGGKASLAQAGGKYKDKLDEALRLVRSLI